jgi:hypothetical protein
MPDGFTRGTAFGGVAREYWQASGDASVAWDSRGNAYYACLQFSRGQPTTNNSDFSSAVYVYRSTGDGGASWNFPGRPVVETFTRSTTGVPLTDKPYIAVDSNPASPFRDRVYVTWTQFAADGTAYIYEVHSNDYGQTFSNPVVVSTTSSLCSNTLGLPTPQGSCNANQFSDPFIGPDGTLYVAFDNTNTTNSSGDNHFQVVPTHSTDGGAAFTGSATDPRMLPVVNTAPGRLAPTSGSSGPRSRPRDPWRPPTTTGSTGRTRPTATWTSAPRPRRIWLGST